MGRTHRLETTFPRLAEPLGYVPKEDILYAVKAIVVTQRENGRRDDRKYSRLKYLISSWGIEKFRTVVEQYYGKKFEPFRELPEWEFQSYLGWHEQVGSVDQWIISDEFILSSGKIVIQLLYYCIMIC